MTRPLILIAGCVAWLRVAYLLRAGFLPLLLCVMALCGIWAVASFARASTRWHRPAREVQP
jgi:hypothetical protein